MAYYAQIDEMSRAVSVIETASEINDSHMIPIGSLDASILGSTWTGGEWVPPEPQDPDTEPLPRHITVGAFFDRFGASKWAILADTTPTVQAVIKDASVRKYIDLDRADLPAGLQVIIDAGHAIDSAAILGAEIQPKELP